MEGYFMGMVSLGKTKLQVSEIIQGTWVMGKDYWGGAEDRESAEAIQCALEHGINTFDTCLLYTSTRHVMLHLNDCCRWKQEIRTKKKFFRS